MHKVGERFDGYGFGGVDAGVPPMKFEEYSELYKDYFHMKRRDGIIEVQLHTDDGPTTWGIGINRAIQNLFRIINDDHENEVLILTGSGDKWLAGMDPKASGGLKEVARDPKLYAKFTYDGGYANDYRVMMNQLYDLQIPVVAAINGWSLTHTEFMLICDITICTPDSEFKDVHFGAGTVPGDGQLLVFQELLGAKRAAYLAYMNKGLNAQEALELGVVNEVVPNDELLDRAWEIAETIAKQDVHVTRLTHDLVKRPWRKAMEDLEVHFKSEMWGYLLSQGSDDEEWFDKVHRNDAEKGELG